MAYKLEELIRKEVTLKVTEEIVAQYAIVSGDHNPIHVSKKSAMQAGFPNKVAHGMLMMWFSTKTISPLLEKNWIVQSMSAKFMQPLFVKDQLIVQAILTEHNDEKLQIKIAAHNQFGELVMKGKIALRQ